MAEQQIGRPKASSREVLAEAACELFLERGYEATSVADITTRAGVSRSSFFNYFGSKGDVLWAGLDERIGALVAALETDESTDAAASVHSAVAALGEAFAPDSLALAIAHADAMGLAGELERESAVRRGRIGRAVSRRLRRGGVGRLRAEVRAAAYGGAVLAAIEHWAHEGPGVVALPVVLRRALDEVAALPVADVAEHSGGDPARRGAR
jgi:AcrR family transcriptional regulator